MAENKLQNEQESRTNEDAEQLLTSQTSTDESPAFPAPNISIRRVMPSLGPRRISLRSGAVVHKHSENNHT